MSSDPTYLDYLREARAGEGRGNGELVRAMLPLLRQVQSTHESGLVAPLDGTGEVFVADGQLWFRSAHARPPRLEPRTIRALQKPASRGVEVGAQGVLSTDLDTGVSELRVGVQPSSAEITAPAYLPGYTSWEQEVGHHDALTDVFALGMLFGSLATGLDFTEIDELEEFARERHRLTRLNQSLHPVLARAIVRMTEVDRHKRAQDLEGLIARIASYRDVDERADEALDFDNIEGFLRADRGSRRKMILAVLQSRLFDISRRNRLIWFKPTRAMLDLTVASVPTQLAVESIRADELFVWDGSSGRDFLAGKPVRLDKYLRLEEAPWIRGTLDKVRSEERRSRSEVGFSQLRLVIAFLNWHNLREDADERIQSPLLLLPVRVSTTRGVRDSYVLQAEADVAEVNPVLRHHLEEVYGLELPDQVDLKRTDVETFHRVLAAAISRSEPAVTLHYVTRPQIEIIRERARRRLDDWRRRGGATGRGLRTELGVEYSYSRSNFNPLGLQLFLQKVAIEDLALEEHLRAAASVETVVPGPDGSRATETECMAYRVTEFASGPYDWAVDLTHFVLGNFNYRNMSLVRDYTLMLGEEEGEEHPSFDRLFSLNARELEPESEGEAAPLGPALVVPADPTQTAAIRKAQDGRSFIIQGPPGTGKSQTITNLIADFAARGKRVLFVCQKRAALDVVYHRLSQHGLDELSVIIHDAQSDKKAFLADLEATYRRWSGEASNDDAELARAHIEQGVRVTLEALDRFREAMVADVAGGKTPMIDVLGERLELGPPPTLDPADQEQVPSHAEWHEHRDAIHEAARSVVDAGESPILSDLALSRVGSEILDAPRPVAALREGLDEFDRLLDQVRAAAENVRKDASSDELLEALALAQQLERLLPDRLALLDPASPLSQRLATFVRRRKSAARELEKASAAAGGWTQRLGAADARTALDQARGLATTLAPLRLLSPAWWRLRATMRASYDFGSRAVRPSWTAILEELTHVYDCDDRIRELEQDARDELAFDGTLDEFQSEVDALRDIEGRSPLELELRERWLLAPSAVSDVLAARTSIHELRSCAARVFDGGGALSFDALAELSRDSRAAADLLPEVQESLRQLLAASPAVREAVRSLPLTADEWDRAVSQSALERTFRENRPLARFTHATLTRRESELARGHADWLEANAEVVRARARERFRARLAVCALPAAKLTDEEKATKRAYNAGRRVLEREFEKVMRHRSIRDLSQGDSGTVVYDLKPIWLMSPLSISETVPIDEQRFDVVIFDEASQIPVEEAVPAVYRAPQMIVVGDTMQLPPTSFFASTNSRTEFDADDELLEEVQYDLEAESFLSHAALKLPSTMLGWHYRSRHEALIRFSNHAFYEGRLKTIPDRRRPAERAPIVVEDVEEANDNVERVLDRPVSYHRLVSSPYTSRTNAGEAAYIARLVRGLLRRDTRLTLGVVAFSEAQQGVIEEALAGLAQEDPRFGRELEAEYEREDDGQYVGLFVKNLENVQGDERDIVILSICYGPDDAGKMRMNFGPINKGGGEKRLNVVFSRARLHMAVVASIDHTAITNEFNDGAMCFRRYLQYAMAASIGDEETAGIVMGALAYDSARTAVRSPSSAIVGELADAIRGRGLRVAASQGTSEFRVDVAVARPGSDEWGVAVLVDTPWSYAHLDVLEQHHARPSVLRAFGWTVVPILTKDWLADPSGCLDRVERAASSPETFEADELAAALEASTDDMPAAQPEGEPAPGEPSPPPPPAEPVWEPAPESLEGKTVVITGRLSELSRAEATQLVRQAGGIASDRVSSATDLLVVGQRPGSKLRAAQDACVRIIDEATFLSWVRERGES